MDKQITIVSGLPRSGTSLMMQMLAAAGIPIQQDGIRTADISNPHGYFEWDLIKQLAREPRLIAACEGRAVKVISSLLPSLPDGFDYRIVFLERNLTDVISSQAKMMERLGTHGGRVTPELMRRALEAHRHQVYAWLDKRPADTVLKIEYEKLLSETTEETSRLGRFLNLDPSVSAAMAVVADPHLRHERHGYSIG